ncbi:signal transduction histidine kinase [Leifsonia sp. AK011]|uniref:sensor histidine kinase n=1 Tax=Leifsonia sp. AK011 TaxID=2723075 RepID=UPI0015CBF1BB|nr:histidine kinase [Leifsonia sp. AK011]NYF09441.1 signal transduction histidine kinase [Leifsonia sp. AK011]
MQRTYKTLEWIAGGLRTWMPPAGGAIFLALWIIAEAGRYAILEKTVVFAILAVAIAVAGWKPLISLSLLLAVPLLQLLGILYPPMENSWPMYEAVALVAFIIGFTGVGLVRRVVLPVGAATSALFALLMVMPSPNRVGWASWVGRGDTLHDFWVDLVTLSVGWFLLFVLLWTAGVAGRTILRERRTVTVLRDAEVRLVETDFELRLAEDRARISRDVHDALAHSLAVIVSQAEGAVALQGRKPEVVGDALGSIASVGRSALTDVRSLVERIHDQDLTSIAPRIDDVPEVIHRMRQVGMDATLQVLGTPEPLSDPRELAVFRIVQESLTNALKHAGSTASARVTLDWQGPGLAILVVSRPSGEPPAPAAGRGIGIAGMKERARLAGGWLTAEAEGRDFLVTAFIPASTRSPAEPETEDLIDA